MSLRDTSFLDRELEERAEEILDRDNPHYQLSMEHENRTWKALKVLFPVSGLTGILTAALDCSGFGRIAAIVFIVGICFSLRPLFDLLTDRSYDDLFE